MRVGPKQRHPYLAIGSLAVLGFLAGFAARHRDGSAASGESLSPKGPAAREHKAEAPLQSLPALKSTDTVEALSVERGDGHYDSVALWLLDAPIEEIAQLGQALIQDGRVSEGTVELLLTHWTRKDPAAALAATKSTRFERAAWWAWASNDPEAALAASRNGDVENRSAVLWALTLFHPQQALKALEDPALAASISSVTLAEKIAIRDPRAAMELLKKEGWPDMQGPLRQWARREPRAALEWLIANGAGDRPKLKTAFVETVERENPEELASLAAVASAGEVKRLLEAAAFRYLAETDPAAALAEARASESPMLAAERLVVLGRGMVGQNPQAALGLLGELLQACPDAASRRDTVALPGGNSAGDRRDVEGLFDFVKSLANADPRTTVEAVDRMLAGQAPALYGGDLRTCAAWVWASRDLESFTAWLAADADPAFSEAGHQVVIGQLAERRRFSEAMAQLETLSGSDARRGTAIDTFERWLRADAKAATSWFDESAVPEETRQAISHLLPRNQ